MSVFYLTLLALAISLDNFCVGVAYGVRKIDLPFNANLIISSASGIAILLSMLAGSILSNYLSVHRAQLLGALIILFTGLWIILQAWWQKWKNGISEEGSIDIKIKSLGIVIRILNDPSKADLDHSGIISNWEALILGVALALNALGAGFGAAMEGLSPWLTSLAATVFSLLLISLGVKVGQKYMSNLLGDKIAIVSGLALVLLAVWEFIT